MTQFAHAARAAKIEAETAPLGGAENISIAPKPLVKPGEMSLVPMDGWMIVRPIVPLKMSPGGIHLPDRAVQNPNRGTVMALGEFATRSDGTTHPWKIAIGDEVHWRDIGALLLEYEGEKFIVIGSEDITLRAKRDGEA